MSKSTEENKNKIIDLSGGEIELLRQEHELWMYISKSLDDSCQSALKVCFLVNGGAAIAILAYFGSNGADVLLIKKLATPLLIFCMGVFAAVLATVGIYFKDLVGFNILADQKRKRGTVPTSFLKYILFNALIIFIIISMVCFLCGIYNGYYAFLSK